VNNNFRRNANLNIVAAFDSNPEVIGTKVNDIKVNDISEIKEVIKKEGITTVITTVPSNKVQQVIDEAVEAGVTAILNFAPKRLKVPHNVQVQYIDLTTELQTLIYYDENYNNPDLKTL
jgi:redox-sensing transcriptional repressor